MALRQSVERRDPGAAHHARPAHDVPPRRAACDVAVHIPSLGAGGWGLGSTTSPPALPALPAVCYPSVTPAIARMSASIGGPDPLWYRSALIYQLRVRSFCDSNGDGIGDFPGLT